MTVFVKELVLTEFIGGVIKVNDEGLEALYP